MTYDLSTVDALVRCYYSIEGTDDFSIRDELMDLEAAFSVLPNRFMRVIFTHGMQGKSFREIEESTGVNYKAIERRYWKGIELLMEAMNAN